MKRFLLLIVLLLAAVTGEVQCQETPISQQVQARSFNVFITNPPQFVSNIQSSIHGTAGTVTYCYWVVANYTIGSSSPGGPTCTSAANATLSSSNFVIVSWPSNSAVTSYDVLRTTSANPPVGACNCTVATAVTSNQQNDQSNSLSSYTIKAGFNENTVRLSLISQPISAGVTHLWLVDANGNLIIDLSAAGTPSGMVIPGGNGSSSTYGAPVTSIATANSTNTVTFPQNLFPANSVPDGIACRITTTFSGGTVTTFSLADGDTNSYTNSGDTIPTLPLTAGTTFIANFKPPGGAAAYGAASTLTITFDGTGPTAGAMECKAYSHIIVPPTS